MKITVIPSWYPNPKMRTQGLFFRDQARALSKEHEVDVLYCHRGKRFYSNLYTDDGIKTFYWGYRLRIGSILGMISRIFIYCMMFILYQKKRKVDIIHCHSVAFNQDGSAGIAGVILGKLFSIPVVITEHATVFSNKKYGRFEKRLMRWALSNADMIICVSEGLRDILEEMTLRQDILIIPNTIDFKTFVNNDIAVHKIKKENDKIKICSVGYLMEKKGFDRLINVINKLIKDFGYDVELSIVGAGPQYDSLSILIRQYDLQDSIFLLGELDKKKISELMLSSDLFILLSRVETFGVVIIEGLATGLYCVATKCGGPEYIIKDKKLGHLLKNTNDVEYLSSEIDNLLQNKAYDKDQIYRMSYARQEYGFERFLELFNDLVLKKYENK